MIYSDNYSYSIWFGRCRSMFLRHFISNSENAAIRGKQLMRIPRQPKWNRNQPELSETMACTLNTMKSFRDWTRKRSSGR